MDEYPGGGFNPPDDCNEIADNDDIAGWGIRGDDFISDDNGDVIPHFKIYIKVAETFKKLNESEDMCKFYKKALNAADSFIEEKKSIEKLIKENCK